MWGDTLVSYALLIFTFLQIILVKPISTTSSVYDVVTESDSCNCAKGAFEDCSQECCPKKEEKIIACYFTNWAVYRSGVAKFTPENINITLCTHIIYAFSSLNDALVMNMSDYSVDITLGYYEKIVKLCKKHNKTALISVGGWNNSKYYLWNAMMANSTSRQKFIASVVTFLKKYGFDGIDMDYEYPGCPQGNTSLALNTSKYDFNKLLKELKEALGQKYLLTVAVAGGLTKVKECYEMKTLCGIVDWVNVMTYEYHSSADLETGGQAPICNTNTTWGVYHSIKYYLRVCPAHKIVMGLPFYGQSFTMKKTHPAKFGVATSGAGDAGTYTQSAGTLAYYEICKLVIDGYNYGYSRVNGSYAFNSTQFISYDSTIDIYRKSRMIKKYGLRGAMFWALDYDDFNNICGCDSYPLLKVLNQELRCINTTDCIDCY